MPVGGVVAQVVHPNADQSPLARLPEEPAGEGRLQDLGKHGEDVDFHRGLGGSSDAGAASAGLPTYGRADPCPRPPRDLRHLSYRRPR